jgi:single-stranded-DNA-specific exonuclease
VAGRMASAQLAFDLLMGEDPDEIRRITRELNLLNSRRQHEEAAALDEVRRRYKEKSSEDRTFVMADPKWPSGIIGIIASRIQQEIHYGPTVILSIDEGLGIARGSARSIAGYDIHAALKRCEQHLIRWGGHKMAAGLTISLDEIEAFAARFEQIAMEHPPEIFTPQGKVDMELDLALVSPQLLEFIRALEPHGPGNPTPTFAAKKVRTRIQKVFGKEQNHLQLLLEDSVTGVYWRGHNLHCREDGNCMDVVFQLEWDNFLKKPILNIKETGNLF